MPMPSEAEMLRRNLSRSVRSEGATESPPSCGVRRPAEALTVSSWWSSTASSNEPWMAVVAW